MARAGHNDRSSSGPEAVPPFWLCAGEHEIYQRVLAIARDSWSWAFWLIKKQLNDGPRSPDIVEDVAQDVKANHQLSVPDWTKDLEDRLALKSLLPFMSHPVRRILHYRQLDYPWKQIGQRLALTEKQAKLRFYYGVRQAHEELLLI